MTPLSMSTMFDSAVYALRKSAPFTSTRVAEFMAEKAIDQWVETGVAGDEAEVVFKVYRRPDVASRLWWTMTWFEAGQIREVSAQEAPLCMWRAIQIHKQLERQQELEEKPNGWRTEPGLEDGAGI